MKILPIAVSITFIFLACKAHQTPVKEPKDNTDMPGFSSVLLETGGCRGFCPVYSLRFDADGKADYEGKMNMLRMGKMEFSLSKQELAKITEAIQNSGLDTLPPLIKTQVVDAPHNTIRVNYPGRRPHSVAGSVDRPQGLVDLENTLIEIGEAHGLQLREGVNPNHPNPNSEGMLVVLLTEEINAGNWIMQFTDLKLRLVRRTGMENEWILAYDKEQIREESFLEMLRKMESVKSAKPSK